VFAQIGFYHKVRRCTQWANSYLIVLKHGRRCTQWVNCYLIVLKSGRKCTQWVNCYSIVLKRGRRCTQWVNCQHDLITFKNANNQHTVNVDYFGVCICKFNQNSLAFETGHWLLEAMWILMFLCGLWGMPPKLSCFNQTQCSDLWVGMTQLEAGISWAERGWGAHWNGGGGGTNNLSLVTFSV
jgi:hypothetical protein